MKRVITKLLYRLLNSSSYKGVVRDSVVFKTIGTNINIHISSVIHNPQYITVGNDFQCLWNFRLEAHDRYAHQTFNPEIIIGNNVSCNTDVHIGCINKIIIKDNVMIASRVYISDHTHGRITKADLEIIPNQRELVSKGPVIIEEKVWIGEGVCIFPGVTIGKNSVIGANAVVTKSFPPYSVIAGVPARLIKTVTE